MRNNPCLCGDTECPRCFPDNDAHVRRQYRKALVNIANASAGDYRRGESDADYWRRFAEELRQDARDALEQLGD